MRERQRLFHHGFGLIALPEVETLENGNPEVRLVDQSVSTLPDVSTTDLETLLKAGVNLQRVNTKICANTTDEITVSVGADKDVNSEQGAN